MYDAAINALRTLKVNDFVQMKHFQQPPPPIKLALEGACIMLGIKPKAVDENSGPGGVRIKTNDYWPKSKKLLHDYKKFIASLEMYEKDNIPNDRLLKIQAYLDNPEFDPAKIKNASEAAEGICMWVISVCKYNKISKEIAPKRQALVKA
jgi:dynein heavy chain